MLMDGFGSWGVMDSWRSFIGNCLAGERVGMERERLYEQVTLTSWGVDLWKKRVYRTGSNF